MTLEWANCTTGRLIKLRAVSASPGCDDWFHDDDGTLCRHPKRMSRSQEDHVEALRLIEQEKRP
jgi:hypothetical protein